MIFIVQPEESFGAVMKRIESNIFLDNSAEPFVIDFMAVDVKNVYASSGDYSGADRVYFRSITDSQKSDIRYILTTLASKSWSELLKAKSSLNRAGDRIDSIHPLRFLITVFSNEELKGSLHSIRDRKKIWDNFFEGLGESLQEESQKSNMQPEMVQDFANTLGINIESIRDLIQSRKWENLVDTLLKLLPRQGNPGRYDM